MIGRLRREDDLAAVAFLAPLLTLTFLLVPSTPVKVLAAIPFCLILPGYSLQALIFATNRLEITMRISLTVGLSLASLVLGGLILNVVPGGLRAASWTSLLLIAIESETLLAWFRRTRAGVVPSRCAAPPLTRRGVINAVTLLVAAGIAGGAFAASRTPLGAPNTNGYESLSVASTDGNRQLNLEVVSARQYPTTYRLRLQIAGLTVLDRTVRLAPGASEPVTIRIGRSAVRRQVQASVVMLGAGFTPRTVSLQLPASSG